MGQHDSNQGGGITIVVTSGGGVVPSTSGALMWAPSKKVWCDSDWSAADTMEDGQMSVSVVCDADAARGCTHNGEESELTARLQKVLVTRDTAPTATASVPLSQNAMTQHDENKQVAGIQATAADCANGVIPSLPRSGDLHALEAKCASINTTGNKSPRDNQDGVQAKGGIDGYNAPGFAHQAWMDSGDDTSADEPLSASASEDRSSTSSDDLTLLRTPGVWGDCDVVSSSLPRQGRTERLTLNCSAVALPQPSKAHRGGEDAYFVSPDGRAFGVADGVGGWAEMGVDAGLYARELMAHVLDVMPQVAYDPIVALVRAHRLTKAIGSTTACIIALSNDESLTAANLGDSGFMVVRNGDVVFHSPVQQHSFNFTYQIGSHEGDHPECADEFSIAVQEGDIIVAGTDGVLDNVFCEEILDIIQDAEARGYGPDHIASQIVALAREHASDPFFDSPFAMAAEEAGFLYRGGKMDDITAVVARVQEASSGPSATTTRNSV